MSMEDWAKRLDGFQEFNGTEILTGAGKISAEKAKLYAESEFEKYRVIQDKLFMSDYEKFLIELEEQADEIKFFAVRVSKNQFVGRDMRKQCGNVGPDTTMRLLNQI